MAQGIAAQDQIKGLMSMGTRSLTALGLALSVVAGPALAQEFDDRWYVSGQAGAGVTDSSNYDSGTAVFLSVGKGLYPNFSVEGSFQFADFDVTVTGANGTTEYTRYGIGVHAVYDFLRVDKVDVYGLAGGVLRTIEFLGEEQDGFSVLGGVGVDFGINSNLSLLADLRYQYDFVDQQGAIGDDTFYSWATTFGVKYKFGVWPPPPPDTDGDGVPDSRDKCPNTPRGAQVDELGCALDSDGDGVPDYRDRCPGTPAGMVVDQHGCPLDSDGDGVIDINDKCPDTPKGVPVDADGCPRDSDGDGVPDDRDLCPNTPFGAEVDVNGCPFDTDQDGVPDFRDKCPNTPAGMPVDADGCERDSDQDGVDNTLDLCPNTFPGLAVDQTGCPQMDQKIVLHDIHFEFNRSDLLPDSRILLDKVIASLKDQPKVQIEVAGHTDSIGTDAYNLKLSQGRSESVVSYLVSQGIPRANLNGVGYGEGRPVAENETEWGRAQNRRVEIHLLSQ